MNLLQRYLFRDLLGATIAGVALFAFLLLAGTFFKDVVGRIADGILTLSQSVELLGLTSLYVLTYALPMGLLTAVLLVLGRISAQHEFTAMRAAGLGLTRIAAPVLLIAVGGVALSLVINFAYAPRAKTEYRRLLADIGRADPNKLIVPGQFVREFPDLVVYAGRREGGKLRDVWVWRIDKQHRVTEFGRGDAATVRWNEEEGRISIVFERAFVEKRNEKDPEFFGGSYTQSGQFASFPAEFESQKVFKKPVFVRKVGWMEFSELVAEHRRLAASKDPADRARLLQVDLDLHEKAALAFSVFSLTLVGVPLGIRTGRSETSANLGIALLLTMGYYFVMIAVGWLDNQPQLHPELLLWLPNILFQALGGWMWWRLGRN